MLSFFFSHPSTFKVLAIWFQDFFLCLVFIIPFYNTEVGVFRHLLDNIFYFVRMMISDDGGKTPLTFCGFYQFHSWECWHWNVLELCSRGRNRDLWLDQDKKSRAKNAEVEFNPTFAFPTEPVSLAAGGKTLDSPAVLLMGATNRLSSLREKSLRFAAAAKTREV